MIAIKEIDRYEQDTKKTQDLQDSGWTVIRVREDLDKVTDNDVVVERHPHKNAKGVANLVLQKIEKVKNIKLENLGAYLENSEPQNARVAKEYYANFLRDNEQTMLAPSAPVGLVFAGDSTRQQRQLEQQQQRHS